MPEQEFLPPRSPAGSPGRGPYDPVGHQDEDPPPWANLAPVRPVRSRGPGGSARPSDRVSAGHTTSSWPVEDPAQPWAGPGPDDQEQEPRGRSRPGRRADGAARKQPSASGWTRQRCRGARLTSADDRPKSTANSSGSFHMSAAAASDHERSTDDSRDGTHFAWCEPRRKSPWDRDVAPNLSRRAESLRLADAN